MPVWVPDSGDIVGSGVLVLTPQYGACVLTATHVVNAALGYDLHATARPVPDERVAFDLPAKGVGLIAPIGAV